uniref:trypsin n=1 Tax=Denticeps clupeoides TaxID=299321 RepID=A0AAY4AVN5_9TELE
MDRFPHLSCRSLQLIQSHHGPLGCISDQRCPCSACEPNPCLNKGVCEEKRGGKFKCRCTKPFKGRRCEKGCKRVCKKNMCGYGQCVLTSLPPFFQCKCKEPFKPPFCKHVAACSPGPCLNGGTCMKDENDFHCQCLDGYSGKFCQVVPSDCYEGNGQLYQGKVSETDDDDECLHWNSYFLLEKGVNPFNILEDHRGLGPHNFCRNPDGDIKPWCFIRKGKKLKWDAQPIPSPASEILVILNSSITMKPPETPSKPPEILIKPFGATVQPPKAPLQPTETPVKPVSPQLQSPVLQNATVKEFATCGRPLARRNRIYGGLKTVPGAQPWQASLQARLEGSKQAFGHVCGGVLIKACWVLTAGHCIDNNKEMQVVLGGVDLMKPESTEQTFTVEKVILHENYKETSEAVYNDIALLQLKSTEGQCPEETEFVKTACLPNATFSDGTECTITGWGATPESQYGSDQLLDAEVLLISQEQCSSKKVYSNLLDDGMFCAGYLKGGVDSCQGDSGGPLTCQKDGVHYLYGLVSWGDSCGQENKPGVYTRVTKYLEWINSKITGTARKAL